MITPLGFLILAENQQVDVGVRKQRATPISAERHQAHTTGRVREMFLKQFDDNAVHASGAVLGGFATVRGTCKVSLDFGGLPRIEVANGNAGGCQRHTICIPGISRWAQYAVSRWMCRSWRLERAFSSFVIADADGFVHFR